MLNNIIDEGLADVLENRQVAEAETLALAFLAVFDWSTS